MNYCTNRPPLADGVKLSWTIIDQLCELCTSGMPLFVSACENFARPLSNRGGKKNFSIIIIIIIKIIIMCSINWFLEGIRGFDARCSHIYEWHTITSTTHVSRAQNMAAKIALHHLRYNLHMLFAGSQSNFCHKLFRCAEACQRKCSWFGATLSTNTINETYPGTLMKMCQFLQRASRLL